MFLVIGEVSMGSARLGNVAGLVMTENPKHQRQQRTQVVRFVCLLNVTAKRIKVI